jgi:GDP-4-dehydro-6-deoxy-D-mannose reductase
VAVRSLVIGASGFVGRHLGAELAEAGHDVLGVSRAPAPPDWPGDWLPADIEDEPRLEADVVYHLAPVGTAYALSLAPTVVVVGSGAEYGVAAKLPITEDTPLRPVTSYGEAKAAQARLVLAAPHAAHARIFNLIGPDTPARLAPGAFARQIVDGAPTIETGWLGGARDYLDIRDAARALRLLAGHSGAFNVCSGVPVRTSKLLRLLVGDADVEVVERSGPSETDVPSHYGDPAKLVEATGWRPEIPLERSVRDLLESLRRGTARA